MSTILHLHRLRPSTSRLAVPCLLLALGCLLASPPQPLHAQFQSDDFNDGNDTGWTRYSPFTPYGAPAGFFFTNGAYRIQAALSPAPTQLGPPRAGSLRADIVYTNFYVSVDIVDWDDTVRQSFGVLARINNFGLGTSIGYAFTYDRGSGVTMTSGDTDLSAIICQPGVSCEIPSGISTGPSSIHLDPAKDYRFVFTGRGPNLEGRIYELPDTTTPILRIAGTDTTYESGYSGLVVYDSTGSAPDIRPDVTFDNYYATDIYVIEPPRITMTKGDFGEYELSWPADAAGFVLQSSPVLPGTAEDWTNVESSLVTLSGDRFVYTMETDPLTVGLPQRFFRLVRPAASAN